MTWGRLIWNVLSAEMRFSLVTADGERRTPAKALSLLLKSLARALLFLPLNVRLARSLKASCPPCVLQQNAGILLKHLRKGYACELDTADRAAIVEHHYRTVASALRAPFLESSLNGGAVIWNANDDPAGPRIVAITSSPHDFEAELTLRFMLGDETLYIMAGIVSPGAVWGSKDDSILVITRVQGIRLAVSKMKVATELSGDCAPRILLFAAMEGLGAALGVRSIFGIGVKRQISTAFEAITTPSFFENYDGFWDSLNALPLTEGLFQLPLPHAQRPLSAIPAKHRSRAQARRTYRNIVTSTIASRFV